MLQVFTIITGFIFLALALATGAALLIILAAVIAVFILYALIRQKLTGKPFVFTRFHVHRRAETREENATPQGVKVIETEYEEIKNDRR